MLLALHRVGHYSNISANFNNLGDLGATFEAPVSSVGGGQSENLGDGAGVDNIVPQPPLPPQPNGIIKIPLSAHKGEDPAADLLLTFTKKIPSGYSVQKQGDGRSYLVPDDGVNEFTYNNGWYVSNDGQLAIGQDEAKKLAVTSNANEGNYPDDGTVAKIVAPNAQLNVFGSDFKDNIVVDNAQINNVYGGVGIDEISGINSAKLSNIYGGSGNDTIKIDNNSVVSKNVFGNAGEDTIVVQGGAKVDGWVLGDTKTKNDMHEKQVKPNLDITDNGAGNDTITISGAGTSVKYIGGGNGIDTITAEKGAYVGLIQADEGDDVITVTGAGTFTNAVNGRGSNDTILVSDQATVENIFGRWGNDDITITGAGTTVTKFVEGNEDEDTIRILNGATVNQYVSGGRGENPSVYGGAQDSDKNIVIIKNATVKGDVEGSTRGGDSEIEISGSTINGKVVGSSDGTKASKLNIEDGSVDFSKVEKITSLELGGADKNLNITLTKDDIFRNNKLKTDGEDGDKVTLDGGGYTAGSSTGGYTKYTATYSGATISVEIKDDIVVIL